LADNNFVMDRLAAGRTAIVERNPLHSAALIVEIVAERIARRTINMTI